MTPGRINQLSTNGLVCSAFLRCAAGAALRDSYSAEFLPESPFVCGGVKVKLDHCAVQDLDKFLDIGMARRGDDAVYQGWVIKLTIADKVFLEGPIAFIPFIYEKNAISQPRFAKYIPAGERVTLSVHGPSFKPCSEFFLEYGLTEAIFP